MTVREPLAVIYHTLGVKRQSKVIRQADIFTDDNNSYLTSFKTDSPALCHMNGYCSMEHLMCSHSLCLSLTHSLTHSQTRTHTDRARERERERERERDRRTDRQTDIQTDRQTGKFHVLHTQTEIPAETGSWRVLADTFVNIDGITGPSDLRR